MQQQQEEKMLHFIIRLTAQVEDAPAGAGETLHFLTRLLYRAMPMRPILSKNRQGEQARYMWKCPSCHEIAGDITDTPAPPDINIHYCDQCGQRLDMEQASATFFRVAGKRDFYEKEIESILAEGREEETQNDTM